MHAMEEWIVHYLLIDDIIRVSKIWMKEWQKKYQVIKSSLIFSCLDVDLVSFNRQKISVSF